MTNIIIGSDHAGYQLKTILLKFLQRNHITTIDIGTDGSDVAVDYPDVAKTLCDQLLEKQLKFGILICGTGIGMSIAANRNTNIRAALCFDNLTAIKAREHNNANILVLGAKLLTAKKAEIITQTFCDTVFEGGRHQRRLNKIS